MKSVIKTFDGPIKTLNNIDHKVDMYIFLREAGHHKYTVLRLVLGVLDLFFIMSSYNKKLKPD